MGWGFKKDAVVKMEKVVIVFMFVLLLLLLAEVLEYSVR